MPAERLATAAEPSAAGLTSCIVLAKTVKLSAAHIEDGLIVVLADDE